jgi:hypothetical protein
MYTKLDDLRIAKKINNYLQLNPQATQKAICMELYTNVHRLKQLESNNLINLQYTKRKLKKEI